MKILVIGCGSIGIRHLSNLLLREDVALAAFDPAPSAGELVESLEGEITFFADEELAYAWTPELVIVATPNHLHTPGCLTAFEHGAHVLCEKPLADSVSNGEKIVKAAQKSDKVLAVGFTERYREAIQFIIDKAGSGFLGNIIGGRALIGTYNTLLCAKNPEFREKTFGSVIIDYVHELDILGEIFGKMKRLESWGNSIADKKLKATPSLTSTMIEYESGAVVSVHIDYVQHPQRRLFEIIGDEKTFVYDFATDSLSIHDSATEKVEVVQFENDRDEQFRREHADVINAIQTGEKPRITGEEAMKSLIVAEAAIERLKM
jgi:predicted dehydrogenase